MRSDIDGRLNIPAGMKSKLESYQQSVRRVKLAEGILAALFGLLLSYILVFALDRVMETPGWLRGLILVTGSLGLGLFFPLKCHKWIWGTRRMEQVAKLLRHKFPRTSDQLLGIVELARSDAEQSRSPVLVQAAMNQVDESIKDRDFSNAVPNARHRRWAWAAAIPALLIAGAIVFSQAATSNAFVRWLMPWKETERYTFAKVNDLPDKIVVPIAEKFDVGTQLRKDTEWSPEAGYATYRDQKTIRSALDNSGYSFNIPPQKEAGSLAVSIGDIRKSVAVEPLARPELKGLKAWVKLPAYLQYKSEVEADVRGGVISLVKGASARFKGTTSRELTEATADGESQKVDGETFVTRTPVLEDTVSRKLSWTDKHGLTPRDPFVLKINALDDSAPIIGCELLDQQRVILAKDTVKFDLNVSDDYGIRKVGLEWQGIEDALRNPNPAQGERIVSAGAPEMQDVNTIATFCAATEGLSPQSFKVRAFAEDYMPDRERTYSAVYTLHILSEDDHFAWMTEQMSRWLRQAEGVYEHELALHDINNQLRQMDAEELDAPKTRRKIEQQAAAERANGARLQALTANGKRMIEEATRNEQFQVGHLETWAEQLQKLEEMAANRMPSVADMLKDAANAQGQPKAGEGKSEKTPPSAGENKGNQSGKSGESSDEEGPENKAPSISDVESGMNKQDENGGDDPPKPPSKGKFGLPQTILQGGPPSEPEACEPQEDLEEAAEEQAEILADFEDIKDALNEVMGELENSTFVKRLKAASRRQIEVAGDLNRTLIGSFGQVEKKLEERQKKRSDQLAKREVAQSENVYLIQQDLEAYFNRKQETKFKEILDDMSDTRVVTKLRGLGDRINENLKGESIVRAEYWADTLDRWAEELVQPAPGGA